MMSISGYPTKKSLREIIHREYPGGPNVMTPEFVRYGSFTDRIAYELSKGRNMDGGPLYGLTVVEERAGYSTVRRPDLCHCSRSLVEIERFIRDKREELTA